MKNSLVILSLLLAFAGTANAQMSVTTIGASEAQSCFRHASSGSSDLEPCNDALRDSTLTRSDEVKTLVNRGIIYNNRYQVQSAIDDFNKALRLNPERGEAYANRGSSYFLAELYDLALSDYYQAIDLNAAKEWATWYNIGLTYQAKKNTDKAKEAFRKSLDIRPEFELARNKLAALDNS